MKFRVTVEHFKRDPDTEERYWSYVLQREIKIGAAEKAAREIEKIITDEGLSIDSNELRKLLFEELDEDEE
jgi:hypothetical protein